VCNDKAINKGTMQMFYHNLKDLTLSAMSWDTLTEAEQNTLTDLVDLYFERLHNPPVGVIGVGAITYAERQLMLAQEGVAL
jgi:hypothetical protein